jgi:hypothetical protein
MVKFNDAVSKIFREKDTVAMKNLLAKDILGAIQSSIQYNRNLILNESRSLLPSIHIFANM